ncbi:endoribonuclease L-PSP [Anopheles sinensis]|uniref:Endoribonuclease L-PSP n=1 Tax=Anopheles sinensis TaxID=74873 RepID=A0A084VM46_ANOSI|nr:endoribonuclease L-PSP [Anopheles sinensis]
MPGSAERRSESVTDDPKSGHVQPARPGRAKPRNHSESRFDQEGIIKPPLPTSDGLEKPTVRRGLSSSLMETRSTLPYSDGRLKRVVVGNQIQPQRPLTVTGVNPEPENARTEDEPFRWRRLVTRVMRLEASSRAS